MPDSQSVHETVRDELLQTGVSLTREVQRLEAMADETRFTLLYLLYTEGELSMAEITAATDRRETDLFAHLDRLEEAEFIQREHTAEDRDSYRITPLATDMLESLFEYIQEHARSVED